MSGNLKSADTYIPFCKDQAMPSIMGAPKLGQSAYAFAVASAPSDGIVSLPYEMDNTSYFVFLNDHTHPGAATVSAANKRTNGITISGHTTADVIDVLIVGTLKGQAS